MTRHEAIEIVAAVLARGLPNATFASADEAEILNQAREYAAQVVDALLHPGYGSATIEDR